MFSFRYTSGVCKHKNTIGLLSYRIGQKFKRQTLVHIITKYWRILQIYISQGSVATHWAQSRGGNVFSDQFITNFPQNVPVENCENRSVFGEDMVKVCDLLFLITHPTLYTCCCWQPKGYNFINFYKKKIYRDTYGNWEIAMTYVRYYKHRRK